MLQLGAGLLISAGLLALAHRQAEASLTCDLGGSGQTVKIGQPVLDHLGHEVGWVSASQCSEGASAGALYVQPSIYGGDLLVTPSASIASVAGEVTLATGSVLWARGSGAPPGEDLAFTLEASAGAG